ncbi:hypothetical protein [Hymenobacter latericus]|uniref:hypothetical protein n=1 Tax=Hymenobacter sp. YIM 151858-1 TaxID=2987688 RepID=UPI002227CCFC|nr:hypothetical protein [Hymenobacter sp. YIM 151858-1]UYZ60066.1 hypothetical protein OIS50_04520 [Hymenobacter sp. YIM 151858-1]
MRHAPRPPFKFQEEIQNATHPKSSKQEIQAVWEQYGYLIPNSINRFNSGHFLRSALASIQTKEQVLEFIESLNEDARRTGRSRCNKAEVARRQLEIVIESAGIANKVTGSELPPDYAQALHCLARRTCCGCHETGSYHPRG